MNRRSFFKGALGMLCVGWMWPKGRLGASEEKQAVEGAEKEELFGGYMDVQPGFIATDWKNTQEEKKGVLIVIDEDVNTGRAYKSMTYKLYEAFPVLMEGMKTEMRTRIVGTVEENYRRNTFDAEWVRTHTLTQYYSEPILVL